MINIATSHNNQKRLTLEDISTDNPFAEDRMRIISSNAFKRLEAKTQVFPSTQGDHYRKRLTHSLEVGEIAKNIARKLALNIDLAEVVAISHDLGHPPFGHAGEDILNAIMREYNKKYDHNTFSFKLVVELEQRCLAYKGLNLTFEVLDGILKHNGPINAKVEFLEQYNADLPDDFKFNFSTHASLEAQVAAIADDIAYNNHDLEDGIRADILKVEDVMELPIFGEVMKSIKDKYSFLEYGIMAKEAKAISIEKMQLDVVNQTFANIQKHKVESSVDVKKCGAQLVQFSSQIQEKVDIVRRFLRDNLYHSKKVERSRRKIEAILTVIFTAIQQDPRLMPELWFAQYEKITNKEDAAELICDYIAGMTDIFAKNLAKKLSRKNYV